MVGSRNDLRPLKSESLSWVWDEYDEQIAELLTQDDRVRELAELASNADRLHEELEADDEVDVGVYGHLRPASDGAEDALKGYVDQRAREIRADLDDA